MLDAGDEHTQRGEGCTAQVRLQRRERGVQPVRNAGATSTDVRASTTSTHSNQNIKVERTKESSKKYRTARPGDRSTERQPVKY
jgi:hypothetical protein